MSIIGVGLVAALNANSQYAAVPLQVNDRAAVVLYDPRRLDLDQAATVARLLYGLDIQLITEPWTAA